MKHLLTAAFLAITVAAHAQIFQVKLTQPLTYYKHLRDTASIPPTQQQYPTGTELQVLSAVNAYWYAVSVVTAHDVAAWYVRRAAIRADLLRSGFNRPN